MSASPTSVYNNLYNMYKNKGKEMAKSSMLYVTLTCSLCKDKIQSYYNHDFRRCKCGKIAIDGGSKERDHTGRQKNTYMRYLGLSSWKELEDALSYEPKIMASESEFPVKPQTSTMDYIDKSSSRGSRNLLGINLAGYYSLVGGPVNKCFFPKSDLALVIRRINSWLIEDEKWFEILRGQIPEVAIDTKFVAKSEPLQRDSIDVIISTVSAVPKDLGFELEEKEVWRLKRDYNGTISLP